MKCVHTANDPVSANVIKICLEGQGIRAEVQDERTFSLRGEVAVVYPTVWVDDSDEVAALKVIADRSDAKTLRSWKCPNCGEEMDSSFSECWKCAQPAEKIIEQPGIAEPTVAPKSSKLTSRIILGAILISLILISYKMYVRNHFNQHFDAANALYGKKNYSEALAELDEALAWESGNSSAWFNRSLVLKATREYKLALADLDHALKLNPAPDRYYEIRAQLYYSLGDPIKALQESRLAGKHPGPGFKILGVRCKFELGDLDGALSELVGMPGDFIAAEYRSLIYYEQDKPDLSLKEAERAEQLDPKNPDSHLKKVRLLANRQNFEQALMECDKAARLATKPEVNEIQLRSVLLYRMNRIDESRRAAHQILEIATKSRFDTPSKIIAYTILGEKDSADREIDTLLKQSPENRWTYIVSAASTCHFAHSLDTAGRLQAHEKVFELLNEARKRHFINWKLVEQDFFFKDIVNDVRLREISGSKADQSVAPAKE